MVVYSESQISGLLRSGEAKTVTQAKQILEARGEPPAIPTPTPRPTTDIVIITPIEKGVRQPEKAKVFQRSEAGKYNPLPDPVKETIVKAWEKVPSESKDIHFDLKRDKLTVSYTKVIPESELKLMLQQKVHEKFPEAEILDYVYEGNRLIGVKYRFPDPMKQDITPIPEDRSLCVSSFTSIGFTIIINYRTIVLSLVVVFNIFTILEKVTIMK